MLVLIWQSPEGLARLNLPVAAAQGESIEAAFVRMFPAYQRQLAAHKIAPNMPQVLTTDDKLPAEEWADAWAIHEGSVIVHLERAKMLVLQRIKQEQVALRKPTDQAFAEAVEHGPKEKKIALEQYRNALAMSFENSKAALAQMTTLEEVAAYKPTWPAAPAKE